MHSTELMILFIMFLMLAVNSVFAAYEIALASLTPEKIRFLAESGRKGAKAALAMKNRMEASLAVVQIGITLAGAISAATGGSGAEEMLAPYMMKIFGVSRGFAEFLAIASVVIPLTCVTIIFGELVPKSIALRHRETVCLVFSPMMRFFAYIFYPTVVFFETVTKYIVRLFERRTHTEHSGEKADILELKSLATSLRAGRVITIDQEKMIVRAGNFSNITVSEIQIPIYDIVSLYVDDSLPDLFVRIHLDPYTRFPVVSDRSDPQSIIGYVNMKELVFLAKTHPRDPNLREILRPLDSFTENTPVSDALKLMMRDHVHLALIRDAKNRITGMITTEDILEEVVGDIRDEFDRLPKHTAQMGHDFVVGGGVTVNTLFSLIKCVPDEKYPDELTFSDWVKDNYHAKIKGGDVIVIGPVSILVRKVRMNSVFEATVSVCK